jgi:hypothetical protein
MSTLGIFWALWAVITVGIMLVDRILSRSFDPLSPTYFALAAITPFMVLPLYFFSSHRRGTTKTRWGLAIAGLPLTCVAFGLGCYQFIAVANVIHVALG